MSERTVAPSSRFVGKVAIVTGGAGGFGAAICRRLVAEGARVTIADLALDRAAGLAAELGPAARAQVANVAIAAEVAALVDATVEAFGGLDVLVNNAGYTHRTQPVWELSEADFDGVVATNFKGVWLGVKYAVPHLIARGGGVIVNTASIGAVAPRPGVTVYNGTKGAVMTMTRGLAVELAPHNIRVNAVNPVAADTGFMKGAYGRPDMEKLSARAVEALTASIPLGRLTDPQDVAASVCFLASDEARFLTGVCLPVDGGRSIS